MIDRLFLFTCLLGILQIALAGCPTTTSSAISTDQDMSLFDIPAAPPSGKTWVIQPDLSDNFDYVYAGSDQLESFGSDRWINFYHNGWDGPGTTYWQYDHVGADGKNLVIRASRNPNTAKMGVPGISAGCVTSSQTVVYPVYIEARVSVADIALASDIWLLSPDDTQEIDMIECYGGAYQGNEWFAQFIHMSHHSFIRSPFTDYQPRDQYSWVKKAGVASWGDYCRGGSDRRFVRVGLNWISPYHFEYYLDGELVRVLYDKAFASKEGGTWHYTYPTMTDGVLDMAGGYQRTVAFAQSNRDFDMETLKAASAASEVSVIDPYGYQGGGGFNKPMDIIINMESQNWHVQAGRTPSDSYLASAAHNKMLVDWIKVCKPEVSTP